MMTRRLQHGIDATSVSPVDDAENGGFFCDKCSTRFRRREHLERHQRRHSQARPFQCQSCSKSFSRKDTLKRHVSIHGPNAVRSYERTARDSSKRVLEACDKCTTSKQRCNGQYPCDRCTRKGWGCYYPKGRSQSEKTQTPASVPDPEPGLSRPDVGPDDRTQSQKDTSAMVMDNQVPSLFNDVSTDMFEPLSLFGFDDDLGDLQINYGPDLLATGVNQGIYTTSTVHPGDGQFKDNTTHAMDSSREPSFQSISLHPTIHTEEQEVAISEDFCHVKPVPDDAYQAMLNFYYSNCQIPPATQVAIPSREVVNSLAQVYFEYFHPLVPIIHVPTFQLLPNNWVLLAAVAGIGCQYSTISNRVQYCAFLHGLLDKFIIHIPTNRLVRGEEVYAAQAVLLHNTWLMFQGTKGTLYRFQYQRNILITMCRPFLVGQGSVLTESLTASPNASREDEWHHWALVESWKRTIYCTWLIECYSWVYSDTPPILQHWELSLSLPCDAELWEASSCIDWQEALSHRQEPPSLLHLFRDSNIGASIKSLNEFGQFISMISIYTVDRNLSFMQLPPCPRTNDPTFLPDTLDAIINEHTSKPQPSNQSPITLHQEKLAHLLAIIRFTPMRALFTAHGWRCTPRATEDAAKQLQEKMKDSKTTRRRLLHAACLFRIIREQRIRAFCDGLSFLIATLLIHQVLLLVIAKDAVSPDSAPRTPLHIDVPLAPDVRDAWIEDVDWNVHVTGVGVLNRPDSATRLLKESTRVLQGGGTAWSRMSHALAQSMIQFLNGQAPTMASSP